MTVRLRPDLPFRRIAVVLSGGGALGAYQIGVLRVLEAAGIRPEILCGLSVGAINAVAWLAHDFRTRPLTRTWSRIGPSHIGMRWTTLTLRVLGLFVATVAVAEIVLTLVGSDELAVARFALHRAAIDTHTPSLGFDLAAWSITGVLGWMLARIARRAEDWLSRFAGRADPSSWHRMFGIGLIALLVAHVATWIIGWPFPHRFSGTVIVAGAIVWLLNRRGRTGDVLRGLLVRLSPEAGGRGLWRGLARTHLLRALVARGDRARLTSGATHLLVNAVSVDTGRLVYFVNWRHPSRAFRDCIASALGEIMELGSADEVIEAAAASSAIPVLFQPVRIRGRDFVDAGMFASRALHAVIADGADAILVVLMSPQMVPHPGRDDLHLFEVGSRLLELGNWRDLRVELLNLGPPWTREGDPAPVCVVEPEAPLPGSLLRFEPRDARALIVR
ncbi:MAG TPA: patatin-like phospholipase family protein, partial [Candidatus Eisenbacteria bacterium]|nr:patatin-like phospholipase family protein [Candidatus Eisenbacteria bacterium]